MPPAARVLLVEAGQAVDVFDVVEVDDGMLRVRTAYLFELGEEMKVRVERDGATVEALARVLAHRGPETDKITELEIVPL